MSRIVRCWAVAALFCALVCRGEAAASAEQILQTTGVKGGLVVVAGCRDGRLAAALHAGPAFLVHGLAASEKDLQAARRFLMKQGLYGPVSADRFDGVHLPYADNEVDLLVAESLGRVSKAEAMRVLRPGGALCVRANGKWTVTRKPARPHTDEWTHFLHGSDNNAVARDRVIAAPRGVQWAAKPLWGRSHEELASLSAAVSAGGRVFYIVDEGPLESIRFPPKWSLVARDAFNGVLLWKRPIAGWVDPLRQFRSGPAHLARRLVAAGDRVYVTLGLDAPVSQLDAATGQTLRTYDDTAYAEEILFDRGVLYLVVGSSEIERIGPGIGLGREPKPAKLRFACAIDAESGRQLWKKDFSEEFLLPLTLAERDGRVFYKTLAHVGCLDAKTGRVLWETPAPSPERRMAWSAPTLVAAPGVVLCADRVVKSSTPMREDLLVWGVSGWNVKGFPRRGKCRLTAYDAASGKPIWSRPCGEGYNSPADVFVIGRVVYVGPRYEGYDLKTGELVKKITARGAPVGMVHHRCYRDKATERYIFTGRSGVELVDVNKGWGGWAYMANAAPAGRILAFDSQRVCGFGRKLYRAGATGHRSDATHLFALPRSFQAKRPRRRYAPPKPYFWTKDRSLVVRAMALAGDRLCIAGPPDVARRDPARLVFENEREAIAAREGRLGAFLRVLSAKDGRRLAETRLPALPAWDGLIAARGALLCLAGG